MTRTVPAYYVAGYNVPGYLPDDDPETFHDSEEPWRFLADRCKREADEATDDDDDVEWLNAADKCRARIGDASGEITVCTTTGNVVLWVTPSTETITLDDEDADHD